MLPRHVLDRRAENNAKKFVEAVVVVRSTVDVEGSDEDDSLSLSLT